MGVPRRGGGGPRAHATRHQRTTLSPGAPARVAVTTPMRERNAAVVKCIAWVEMADSKLIDRAFWPNFELLALS